MRDIIGTIDKIVIYRSMIIIVATAAILIGCFYILEPFIPSLLLATILCLSTWPAFAWLERRLNHRKTLAAALMTLFLALGFLVPLVFLGSSMVEDFTRLIYSAIDFLNNPTGTAPAWIQSVPWAGSYLSDLWITYIEDKKQLGQGLQQHAGTVIPLVIRYGASIGHGLLDLSLGVLIAFFFFRNGKEAAVMIDVLMEKFGGAWGKHLLMVSKNTMIGVVYGILGTALATGVLAAIGFWIAHVPGAAFLGLLTFAVSCVPAGFPVVLVPVTLWLLHNGEIGMAIFMAIWGTSIIGLMDFFVRPFFISLGSSLPVLLVLLGVFGGILAFGFIGIFIGPTLLAVAYALFTELGRAEKQQIISEGEAGVEL